MKTRDFGSVLFLIYIYPNENIMGVIIRLVFFFSESPYSLVAGFTINYISGEE